MTAGILAGRGAMYGTLAAGILLAVVIVALLRLMEPGSLPLLIGVAVTVTPGLLASSRSAVLLGLRWYAFNGHLGIGLLGMAGVAALGRIQCAPWWPTDWLSATSVVAKADRQLVSSVLARRSAP